jgi:hypothetical protein
MGRKLGEFPKYLVWDRILWEQFHFHFFLASILFVKFLFFLFGIVYVED